LIEEEVLVQGVSSSFNQYIARKIREHFSERRTTGALAGKCCFCIILPKK
jgi:hypothetical protein